MSGAPLGILAGGGPLPAEVAAEAVRRGRPVFVAAFEDHADVARLAPYPHEVVRLGAAGRILALLRAHGCREIVLIGPVRRPSLGELRPDREGVRILARIGRAWFGGDDRLLAAVVGVLAEEGFTVRGAHEILGEALGPAGVAGRHAPDEAASADIARGVGLLRVLGAADVGQACVVQGGHVLAVEAAEGTDRMIERAGEVRDPGPGGVLVKMAKHAQDRRADLPTLGPRTVERAAASGLRGIAYEAGGTLFTDLPGAIAAADRAGLFLVGVPPDLGAEPGERP